MAGLTIPYWEVLLRLLLASLLCGAIGFERETRDQPAGFRTHILLGLGAALFTLVSAYGFEPFTRAALQGGASSSTRPESPPRSSPASAFSGLARSSGREGT